MKEALFYEKLDDGRVRCLLCPHGCLIKSGSTGICRARKNDGGTLYATTYAEVTSVCLDPIEKKPLYHFYPGSNILSIGSNGCSFSCPFCQNWEISQSKSPTRTLRPEELPTLSRMYDSIGVSYTYNEPLIWVEYLMDACRQIHKEEMKNVLVTNGYINLRPLEELLPHIDAMNIDIKSMEDSFYKKLCKAKLQPVLDMVVRAKKSCHVEITNLVIPGENDRDENFEALSKWISENTGDDTPLHLSAYYPRYKFSTPPTPVSTLKRAWDIARKYLKFVYIGNVYVKDGRDTTCTSCGALLVQRMGYTIRIAGLGRNGLCTNCRSSNNFVV